MRWLDSISGHEFEQTQGDSGGQRSLALCSPRGCKESDTTEDFHFTLLGFPRSSVSKESACNAGDLGSVPGLGRSSLEKEMATQSIILAWEIPWTEEPGGLQSMGLQRVRYD